MHDYFLKEALVLVLSSLEAKRLEKTFASESLKIDHRETSGGRLGNKTKTERSEGVTFNLQELLLDCSGWQERLL